MRIAIISDIHGNAEALEAVLADIRKSKCSQTVCCGDLVGYGASPRECMELIRAANVPCLKGNHDAACASEEYPYAFNKVAIESILWTRKALSETDKQWLNALPYRIVDGDVECAHANAYQPSGWDYVLDAWSARQSFKDMKHQLCFIGHTHQAVAWVESSGKVEREHFDRLILEPTKRYLINVGSVGQPRDRDPRAAYVIYDVDRKLIDLKRVSYDIKAAQQKIIQAGLPSALADRLASGG